MGACCVKAYSYITGLRSWLLMLLAARPPATARFASPGGLCCGPPMLLNCGTDISLSGVLLSSSYHTAFLLCSKGLQTLPGCSRRQTPYILLLYYSIYCYILGRFGGQHASPVPTRPRAHGGYSRSYPVASNMMFLNARFVDRSFVWYVFII